MKAWQVSQHGGPGALELRDVPLLTPGKGQALVKVCAVGLNHLDVWVRKGVEGHRFPLPIIPGCDIAGYEVKKPGSPSSRRVLVNPILSCGKCPSCKQGLNSICEKFGIIGETRDGGLAEYVVVPKENLIPLPKNVDFITAAALPIAYVTAWNMLVQKAKLKKGEWILIHAAGSGVSIACIQIAKMLNAKIIVTSSDDEKLEKAKKLGAHFGINYREQPFREGLKKILASQNKRGVEVVVDHVGADTFSDSLKSLSWGGRLVTCGATSGGEVSINLKLVFFKSLSILGTTMGSKKDVEKILKLVSAKKIKPVIHARVPFADTQRAFEILEERESFGKVIVTLE